MRIAAMYRCNSQLPFGFRFLGRLPMNFELERDAGAVRGAIARWGRFGHGPIGTVPVYGDRLLGCAPDELGTGYAADDAPRGRQG